MDILKGILSREQRQDSVSDQLNDLCVIARHLGMYDAAEATSILYDLNKSLFKISYRPPINLNEGSSKVYGCHADLEEGQKPDDCVLNVGSITDCIYAEQGMRPEQCRYWLSFNPKRWK